MYSAEWELEDAPGEKCGVVEGQTPTELLVKLVKHNLSSDSTDDRDESNGLFHYVRKFPCMSIST